VAPVLPKALQDDDPTYDGKQTIDSMPNTVAQHPSLRMTPDPRNHQTSVN
jgi:hypothetical protein